MKVTNFPVSGIKFVLFMTLLLTAANIDPHTASAQVEHMIKWGNEEVLQVIPSIKNKQAYPVIAADAYGAVHVFWTEGQTLYYMRKDAMGWSAPIDVAWTPGNIAYPSVAIDHEGILHLVWAEYNQIRYQSVPAQEAMDVQKWSAVKTIVQFGGTGTPLRIAVDPEDHLHVIFVDWYGRSGKTVAGNVYHIQSNDGGQTWSGMTQISSIENGELADDPRMAFDNQGQTHIVWGQADPNKSGNQGVIYQDGIYYARLSRSNIPIPPVEIQANTQNDKWLTQINIGITLGNEIHLVWVCGADQARRCQVSSSDGGKTWNTPHHLFGNLIGLSGWDSLAIDGSGTLYWFTVLRYPQAMYYSYWDGSGWKDPPIPASMDTHIKLGENVMSAIALGNQVHLVAQLGNAIVYLHGETPAPTAGLQSTPTLYPEQTPTQSTTTLHGTTPAVSVTPTDQLAPSLQNASEPVSSVTWRGVILGIVPAILVVAIFLLFHQIKKN